MGVPYHCLFAATSQVGIFNGTSFVVIVILKTAIGLVPIVVTFSEAVNLHSSTTRGRPGSHFVRFRPPRRRPEYMGISGFTAGIVYGLVSRNEELQDSGHSLKPRQ